MRIDQTVTNMALIAVLPACIALFATRKKYIRSFSVTLGALALADLLANVTGHGSLLWWSPLHWPSTVLLGVDEIVENHGVIKTTAAYVADLIIWSVAISGGIVFWRRKKRDSRQRLDGPPAEG